MTMMIDNTPEAIALARLTFGPRPGDLDKLRASGLKVWLDQQLNPPTGDDPSTLQALADCRLPIEYTVNSKTVSENRPLQNLNRDQASLWKLTADSVPWQERIRPAMEVRAAAWIRATTSVYQLREVIVQFWHNHFSINAFSTDESAISFPAFDRQAIRANALGNFGRMLEDVAKSTSMMYYLNQQDSTSQHPNENFAREVMELHTLGIGAYLGRKAPSGAIGYSDDDVINAARALTGWTVGDGSHTAADGTAPDDGYFLFDPAMHDLNPKQVLGLYLAAGRGQDEGATILDALTRHPSTATFICGKLCQRLLGEAAPQAVIDAAVLTWSALVDSPDQIREVIRTIVTHPAFFASAGARVKDPFRLIVSFVRQSGVRLQVRDDLFDILSMMGYRQFEWSTPNGMPDVNAAWIGTNGMLRRWNTFTVLLDPNQGFLSGAAGNEDLNSMTGAASIVDYWIGALLGGVASRETRDALLAFVIFAQDQGLMQPSANDSSGLPAAHRLAAMAVAASPEFQIH